MRDDTSVMGTATSAPFSVESKLDRETLITTITGELDLATVSVLKAALEPYHGRYRAISYELGELTFIDCTGLDALLAPGDAEPLTVQIKVVSASRRVRRLLQLLQMEQILG